MALFGKKSVRHKEIRRSKAERGLVWYRRALKHFHVRRFIVLLFSGIATMLLVNVGRDRMPWRIGERVPRAIASRISFSVFDESATNYERIRRSEAIGAHYVLDKALLDDIESRLTSIVEIVRESAEEPDRIPQRAAELGLRIDEATATGLAREVAGIGATEFRRYIDRAIDKLRREPLVDQPRPGATAVLVEPNVPKRPEQVATSGLLYANNSDHVTTVAERAAAEFPRTVRAGMRGTLLSLLQTGPQEFAPLYRFNESSTRRARAEAEASVPRQLREIPAGAVLADIGEITPEEFELLTREHQEYLAQRQSDTQANLHAQFRELARGGIVFGLIVALGAYMILFYEPLLGSLRRRFLTALALLVLVALARLSYLYTPFPHLILGIQTCVVALLVITSGGGPAYAMAGLATIVLTLIARESVLFAAVLLAVSALLFLGLRDIRTRGRITAMGALAALLAGVLTQLTGFVDGQDVHFVFWNETLVAVLATLGAAFLIEGLLPAIERFFHVTTALTLLEWCDPNKPLLRMLAAESPGTYNHSLLVGTLADAAAGAIGANPLLARAGSYYHDIGKISKPEYFVENQGLGVGNRHERLSPAMSHLIIVGHVKDGMEMAKAYGLPRPLHAFIPEHHGTSVVEYFFHAANKARKPDEPEISDEQFRYPGPKPQSKETAIVMMCDGVEGAVRAMGEPTPNRIEDTVKRIIEKRLMDGQFDECDLTFRELEKIRKSLVKTLSSIYHGRIIYPTTETPGEAKAS